MDMTQIIKYLTIFAAAFFVLVALTNIMTQLFKKLINREKFPTQVLSFVVAVILTILALLIVCSIFGIRPLWYFFVLAVIVGIVVSYVAIFGYDNLYAELKKAIQNLLNAIMGRGDGL